jgi:Fe2+ transport system protein FeoA
VNLFEVKKGKKVLIDSIDISENEDLCIRLMHLGFMVNEPIIVVNKTPILNDVILVNVKGSEIALTKSEAGYIKIREF